MIFSIDYDGTFSEDPEFFSNFVDLVEKHGHKAIVVTQRPQGWNHADIKEDVQDKIPVFFAGERWKEDCAEKNGYHVTVWIDDRPELVRSPPYLIGADRKEIEEIAKALQDSSALLKSVAGGTESVSEKKQLAQNAYIVKKLGYDIDLAI